MLVPSFTHPREPRKGHEVFYATPALDTVTSWAQQITPDFRFILKLPKPITHEHHLADVDDQLRAFLAAVEPLGQRAHALWIQLPPSFGPADLGALTGFLRRLPREYRYCAEVRHRAFFQDPRSGQQLERALGDAEAEWVTFDTTVLFQSPPVSDAEREAWMKKPRLPRRSRALTSYPVVRYIGRDDPARTVAGWQHWLDAVAAGCVRGVPRPSSSIPPTTPARSSWPADSMTRYEPGCPRSSLSQTRSPPDRQPSSEPRPGTASAVNPAMSPPTFSENRRVPEAPSWSHEPESPGRCHGYK